MSLPDKPSKVCIIGAGFTGLGAAMQLSRDGYQVTVFEAGSSPGGLAAGFTASSWDWAADRHYHHLFASDRAILQLAAETGVPVTFTRPVTSTYCSGSIHQLDSPLSLLRFSRLPLIDRLRTGLGLAMLKYNPFWQPLEHFTSAAYIQTVMGRKSWDTIWEPLFTGKFAHRATDISAAWFWARIYKRSSNLGYPEGGFAGLLSATVSACRRRGVVFHFDSPVKRISVLRSAGSVRLTAGGHDHDFTAVICTLPAPAFAAMTSGLPSDYSRSLAGLKGIGAVSLVLALKQPFLPDNVYWLNINDRSMPFLAAVEHTNFVSPARYAGDRLLYLGNYLPDDHPFFRIGAVDLLTAFTPHLIRLNPGFSPDWVKQAWVWQARFAQPIITRNYSRQVPPLTTPLPGVYLANLQQVYPWDRGTNYAVELGQKVAGLLSADFPL